MAKMYIMGKYSEKAFLGFLKDPTTDRKAAVEKLTSAAGGKMLSMDIVRGPYDFIVVAEMANFETTNDIRGGEPQLILSSSFRYLVRCL